MFWKDLLIKEIKGIGGRKEEGREGKEDLRKYNKKGIQKGEGILKEMGRQEGRRIEGRR